MDGYDVAAWADFAVASAAATAALTGLILVVVAINPGVILRAGWLPGGAALTVGLLLCLLIVNLCVLAPGQTPTALGLEVIGAAAVLGLATVIWAATSRWPDDERPGRRWTALAAVLVPVALLLVGGTSIATSSSGGLYWVFAAVVVGIAAAVLSTWLLLVESSR